MLIIFLRRSAGYTLELSVVQSMALRSYLDRTLSTTMAPAFAGMGGQRDGSGRRGAVSASRAASMAFCMNCRSVLDDTGRLPKSGRPQTVNGRVAHDGTSALIKWSLATDFGQETESQVFGSSHLPCLFRRERADKQMLGCRSNR